MTLIDLAEPERLGRDVHFALAGTMLSTSDQEAVLDEMDIDSHRFPSSGDAVRTMLYWAARTYSQNKARSFLEEQLTQAVFSLHVAGSLIEQACSGDTDRDSLMTYLIMCKAVEEISTHDFLSRALKDCRNHYPRFDFDHTRSMAQAVYTMMLIPDLWHDTTNRQAQDYLAMRLFLSAKMNLALMSDGMEDLKERPIRFQSFAGTHIPNMSDTTIQKAAKQAMQGYLDAVAEQTILRFEKR